MARPRSRSLWLATALLAFAQAARATTLEQRADPELHPTEPDVVVLHHEHGGEGLFYTGDGGASWRMVCGAPALSSLPLERPDQTLAGLSGADRDSGSCSAAPHPSPLASRAAPFAGVLAVALGLPRSRRAHGLCGPAGAAGR